MKNREPRVKSSAKNHFCWDLCSSAYCFLIESVLSLDLKGYCFFSVCPSSMCAFHFPHENKVRLKLHRGIYLFLSQEEDGVVWVQNTERRDPS